jgi:hypothetical protein
MRSETSKKIFEETPQSVEQPYFKIDINDYGKPFLFYNPRKDGYHCWLPINDEFKNEFEQLLVIQEAREEDKKEIAERLREIEALRKVMKDDKRIHQLESEEKDKEITHWKGGYNAANETIKQQSERIKAMEEALRNIQWRVEEGSSIQKIIDKALSGKESTPGTNG